MWELHQIEDMDKKRAMTQDAVEALRTRLQLFFEACKHLLANSSIPVFREEARKHLMLFGSSESHLGRKNTWICYSKYTIDGDFFQFI